MSKPEYRTGRIHLSAGGNLAYQYRSAERAQPTMLLLHGMGGSHQDMYPLAEKLGSTGGRGLLLPDLPGHGGSDESTESPSIAGMADRVAELVRAAGDSETCVVGHSLGAAVATALGARHPELVSRLALLDPGMAFPNGTAETLRALYDQLTPDNFAGTVRDQLTPMLFAPDDPSDFVETIVEVMIGLGVERFRALGYAIVGFDATASVRDVVAPTMLIGTANPLFDGETIRVANPGWLITEQPDTSHYGLLVRQPVHEQVAWFLAGVHPPGGAPVL